MEIRPTVPQDKFMFSESPFPLFVGGFGSGKTEALINRAIVQKVQNPALDRAFYEPTYDLIRMIAWPRFEEKLEALGIPYRLTKHPTNVLEIEGHGRIIFRSMDAPQRIVGYEVADSDVDELDTMKRDDAAYAWRQIIARNRYKKPSGAANTVAVATTPEGFRFVYETWEVKQPPGYEVIRAPTYSNPHLPEGYIDSLKDIYPDNLLQAYLEGRFVNLTGNTIYNAFDRSTCHTDEVMQDGERLYIGQDFNIGKMASVVYVKRGDTYCAVDELVDLYDTPALIESIKERYPKHGIVIYPDASGGSRKTVNASTSDIALLKQAGFTVRVKSTNPPVRDRIMSVNGALSHGRMKVNTSQCPEFTRCLEQQPYDKNGEPNKNSGFDHMNDAGGYPIAYELPIRKPISQIQVIF